MDSNPRTEMEAAVVYLDPLQQSVHAEPRTPLIFRVTGPPVGRSERRDPLQLLGSITVFGNRFFPVKMSMSPPIT